MLREGTTDMAVILTEGIVKDIINGNDSSIVQVYVKSPLIWGIHIDGKSTVQSLTELESGRIAISRFGSGSHLMSVVNAQNQGWNIKNLNFEIVNTIDGAVDALANKKADYFMWERFMTKPLVDKGVFKRIADCPTPWPCFVIAVRNEMLDKNPETIQLILEIINATTEEFKYIPSIDRTLASRYHLKLEDIQEWLSLTEWSQNTIDEKTLNNVQNQLFDLSLIDKKGTFAKMVRRIN
jgi:ABC-type nitrate/sulfonate/bicarbonate transport system substrate-binding protein